MWPMLDSIVSIFLGKYFESEVPKGLVSRAVLLKKTSYTTTDVRSRGFLSNSNMFASCV